MATGTTNPPGSNDPRDLRANAENLDLLITGPALNYPDRLGVSRRSWAGIDASYEEAEAQRDVAFQEHLSSTGYELPAFPYAAGILIERETQLIERLGEFYRAKPGVVPFTTTGTWATDELNLVAVGDAVLRQELAQPQGSGMIGHEAQTVAEKLFESLSVKDKGAVGDGVADDTAEFVATLADASRAQVPDGVYLVDGSQIPRESLVGGPGAVLSYTQGQRVAMEGVANTDALDQLYWQEVKAAPGNTLNLNAAPQAIGICEDSLYMAQNVSSPSGVWASDSVSRFAAFPLARAVSDTVNISIPGGVNPVDVVDLVEVGHGAGASVIREGGKLWLYSTVSAPVGQAQIDGVGCNYGTGFTKTEWKGSATLQTDVQKFRGLQGVFSAEVCVSADGKYLVMAGYRFLPLAPDSSSFSAIPHVSVFDRVAVEAAVDPTTVLPLYNFPVPYIQSLGEAVGSFAGVACDGEFVYLLNGGAQVVGARSLIVMTLSGVVVKAMNVSGFAGCQPEMFRKGSGGKQAFAYEIEGLAFLDDTLMMMSKFNVCTPSTIVTWQGANVFPLANVTGVSPADFGSWARTDAAATGGAYDPGAAYTAPTALVYHKYLTALAPKGRHERPHGVADGLYVDCQQPGYGGYGSDAGYTVFTHFRVGQFDRNSGITWTMFDYRSSGLGRLYDCDYMKSGAPLDATSLNGRFSYVYGTGTTISGGPSVATAATLELGNSRNTSSGDRYGTMWSVGVRAMLWGVNNISYKNLNPNADASLVLGTNTTKWLTVATVKVMYTATVGDFCGAGTPEGVVTAGIGSTYRRTNGGAATSFYVKESGTGNTGWVAK